MNPPASKISLPVFMYAVWHTGIAVCTLPVVEIHPEKLIYCVRDTLAMGCFQCFWLSVDIWVRSSVSFLGRIDDHCLFLAFFTASERQIFGRLTP